MEKYGNKEANCKKNEKNVTHKKQFASRRKKYLHSNHPPNKYTGTACHLLLP